MIAERLFTGVVLFEHFFTEFECAHWLRLGNSSAEWVDAAIGRYQDNEVVEARVDKQLRDVSVLNLDRAGSGNPFFKYKNLIETINKEFNCNAEKISRAMISKYVEGSHIRPHKDTGIFDTSRLVTLVLYLNDEFTGGEIFFPDLGIEISPKPGSLLGFYSEFRHGVRPIKSGERYCIVGFAESEKAYQRTEPKLALGKIENTLLAPYL